MNMLKNFSEKFEGDERTHIDKEGGEIVNSYRIFLSADNSSESDRWVMLNS